MVIYAIAIAVEEIDVVTTGKKKAIIRLTERIYFPGDILVLQYAFADTLFMQTFVTVTNVEIIGDTGYVVLSIEKHTCDYCRKELDVYVMKVSAGNHYHADCLDKIRKERIAPKRAPAYYVEKCSCGKRFITMKKREYGRDSCNECWLEQEADDYYVGSPDEWKERCRNKED
ncbi:hypothetical protein [Listeria booriae]|uniref:hypothetical protein n=1 Tax=Listeria booriae TaxID=1552123 RepID=UPI001624F246|nr:hypothetical protein [Listeria booriae]MBC1212426.1 hypothetical protein [Listeria booriae]MBC1309300.1 hypothetical protein [Listeria booriae]